MQTCDSFSDIVTKHIPSFIRYMHYNWKLMEWIFMNWNKYFNNSWWIRNWTIYFYFLFGDYIEFENNVKKFISVKWFWADQNNNKFILVKNIVL